MTRILIVEDETALREVFVMLFKQHHSDVYEAANGQLALEQLDKVKPDVIILDVLMPVMDGIGFLKAANLPEKYPQTKVLMLSNLSDNKTIAQTQKLGAQKYLLKASASPRELIAAVDELLK
jgi:DNA-binding NarL/FixJ family response regulator